MATSEMTEDLTLIAAENLTIFTAVFIDSSGEAAETNDETQVEGICMETVLAGENVPVMTKVGARVPLRVDGVHAAGARISAGAAGEGVTASTTGGELTVGTVLQASTADQDIIEILFSPRIINEDT